MKHEPRKNLNACPHCGGMAVVRTVCGEYWVECERHCQDMKSNEYDAVVAWQARTSSGVIQMLQKQLNAVHQALEMR